ncbi:hypothetical protein FRB97_007753 [Tulasnella sp. 331]|nr:hypothetical protein FRB97_007753 [Tulasnella sp. 331]
MFQLINDRLSELRVGFSQDQPPDMSQALRLWQGLVDCFTAPPNPLALWTEVLKANIYLIPAMMGLLSDTFNCDTTGAASALAMQTVNMCVGAGLQTLMVDKGPMRGDAKKVLELAVDPARAAGIVQIWWTTLRHLAPQWIKAGKLREYCSPFATILQLDGKDISPALDMLGFQKFKAGASPDIQDFLLVIGIFFQYDGTNFDKVPALALTTVVIIPAPLHRRTDQWAVYEALKDQPSALVRRLEEVMRDREDEFPDTVV